MKLSIITVNYNDAEGLERTIKSVISQSFKDYEFIIIDGGSTDTSIDVIKKYENYLDYPKKQFIDTISLCPNWELVDFYVDEGISAPNMESAKDWCRLLEDCFSGRVDLIITQKVSNVSRKPMEVSLIARVLAAQKKPVGIYFISEDLFTLASYYQKDLHEQKVLPEGWMVLSDNEDALPEEGESIV